MKKIIALLLAVVMEEVFAFGDTITVMKDGRLVDTVCLRDTTEDQIIQMMVGRELKSVFPPKQQEAKNDCVLKVENFGDARHFHKVSFELQKGEILGIGALDGQGQLQLMNHAYLAGRVCVWDTSFNCVPGYSEFFIAPDDERLPD